MHDPTLSACRRSLPSTSDSCRQALYRTVTEVVEPIMWTMILVGIGIVLFGAWGFLASSED
jgi:hypothetical protein